MDCSGRQNYTFVMVPRYTIVNSPFLQVGQVRLEQLWRVSVDDNIVHKYVGVDLRDVRKEDMPERDREGGSLRGASLYFVQLAQLAIDSDLKLSVGEEVLDPSS